MVGKDNKTSKTQLVVDVEVDEKTVDESKIYPTGNLCNKSTKKIIEFFDLWIKLYFSVCIIIYAKTELADALVLYKN